MVEPVSTTVVAFLGVKAADVIGSAVKDYVKGHIKKLIAVGEKKLGRKERDALGLAYENTLAHAYTRMLDALGRVLELTGIYATQALRTSASRTWATSKSKGSSVAGSP